MRLVWNYALSALLCSAVLSGCAAAPAAPAPEAVSGPAVEEHWSVLDRTQRLPAVGTRWRTEPMKTLLPSPNYGELVPFAGAAYYLLYPGEDGVSFQDFYPSYLFGLMTVDGCIVLDPVCTAVYPLTYLNGQSYELENLPVWGMEQADPKTGNPMNGSRIALAAQDGSWATPFQYWGATGSPLGIFAGDGESLSLLDTSTGTVLDTWTWSELGLENPEQAVWEGGDLYGSVHWSADALYLCTFTEENESEGTVLLLNPETGETIRMSAPTFFDQEAESYIWEDGWSVQAEEGGRDVTVSQGETRYTFPSPLPEDRYPYARLDRVIFQNDLHTRFAVTTLEGEVVLPAQDGALTVLETGSGTCFAVQTETDGDWQLYRWDGQPGAVLPGGPNSWCQAAGPLVGVWALEHTAYYRPETGECVFRAWFTLEDRREALFREGNPLDFS